MRVSYSTFLAEHTGTAIVISGLAGALAEVAWVAAYCSLTPLTGAQVLRQITASVFPSLGGSVLTAVLGLILHFALGVAVACGFGILVWRPFVRRMGPLATACAALLTLAAIWTINFRVLLPVVNPAFAGLMPYPVTFASKLLFGAAMARTLNALDAIRPTNGAVVVPD